MNDILYSIKYAAHGQHVQNSDNIYDTRIKNMHYVN